MLLPEIPGQGAVVVDPGGDGRLLLDVLQGNGTFAHTVILTHAHIDHVSGLEAVKDRYPDVLVMMHSKDLNMYEHLGIQAMMFGQPTPRVPPINRFVKDGDVIEHAGLAIHVLHTPGHSKGSICLLIPGEVDLLLSGDTLFRDGIGRTDLWGGDQDQLIRSIREKLLCLDDNTVVVPGHGSDTTIGHENRKIPF